METLQETPKTEVKKLFVNNKDESVRMFKSNFLDMFSRVKWYVPLFIYVPFISYLVYQTAVNPNVSILAGIGLFLGGLFLWSFAEYFLHRFVFHYHPTSKLGKELHFTMHGVHHDYPQDSLRLVLPPAMSLPLAVGFYFLFQAIWGPDFFTSFLAGFVLGYLCYDMFHYATHHANIKAQWFRKLKKHHMDHHYKDDEHGFGVSSTFWDIIFRSGFKK